MPNPTAATLKSFHGVLLNTAVANITTSFLWFAFSFWVYLETRSVLVYSLIGGSYMLLLAILGVPFGTVVDHHRKKNVMVAPEPQIVHAEGVPRRVDFAGAYRAIRAVPGLMGLVLFATLNNLLGGVFMALMDPYGLTLVSVETWGILWGVVSLGFLVGGAAVARWGLGSAPLRALLLANVAMWTIGALFTIRESIVLMAVGVALYMVFIPVAEAAEQTVLQTVVPFAKQGRVFGFATSVEIAATPVSTFVVGPVAQFWLIPYAASDAGRAQLGWLLGGGETRGIALVFLVAGVLGLALTLAAFGTGSYRLLTERMRRPTTDAAA